MGTNYYHNNLYGETRHIGKSSGGWCFSLHVYPDEGINDLGDWLKRFDRGVIVDEYDRAVSVTDMIKTITQRGWGKKLMPETNTSEEGPNNLVRSKIDRKHCVGHGAGTWDLIVGDFS